MNDFFDATPELRIIRQWARARFAAEWAVFGAVLLRVAASTGPELQLPGVIGGRASLNLLAAFVAPSGGGKGISDKVARLAWPMAIIERPIGSGEGIAATFVPPKKEGVEPITRAIVNVPEIDTLAGIASRQGSILLAQLKSAAMGEQLGQANSSEATTRIVPAHTYRLCMSVGAQPAHTGVLFNDSTGGTPQRFLWFPTTDPDMPDDVVPDPEPLNTGLPFWRPAEDGVVEVQYGPEEIPRMVIATHIARQRGQDDALDGHAMLTRLKVAAVLAILHHRIVVSDLDWELSGAVMAVSNRTRDWVVAEGKRAERARVRDRALSRAAGEEFVSDRKMERAKAAVLRWLDQYDELPLSDLRRRARSDWREHVSAAVSELVDEGIVQQIEVDRGHRYRLCRGAHRGPGSTLDNPSSQGVDPGSTVDPGDHNPHANPEHSEAQHRLLHSVTDTLSEPHSRTARQWVADRVAALLADGKDTAESTLVYSEGVAEGYSLDALRQAVKSSPDIAVLKREGRVTVWRLGTGSGNFMVSSEQWLSNHLRQCSEPWVKAADVYRAGLGAGYGRDAVKSAAQTLGVRKRGQSISTEWATALADSGRDVS